MSVEFSNDTDFSSMNQLFTHPGKQPPIYSNVEPSEVNNVTDSPTEEDSLIKQAIRRAEQSARFPKQSSSSSYYCDGETTTFDAISSESVQDTSEFSQTTFDSELSRYETDEWICTSL